MPRPTTQPWPTWTYYPGNVLPPGWVHELLDVIKEAEDRISTTAGNPGLKSDAVLLEIAEGMRALNYTVETDKTRAGKVLRPVLFGENGRPTVTYEVDAAHVDLGIVVEVEAGRGARGNAAYRDIIRSSLILDARYFVLLLPIAYRYATTTVAAYRDAREMLSAIYTSQRLQLPFDGVLLIGY